MPLVCEISIEAYCRPNEVFGPLNIHTHVSMSPNLTIYAQLGPPDVAFAAK
jgi:hypothetical protein